MNGLLNQKFFRLLSEPSQVSMQEIQVAYETFVEQITGISSIDSDYSKVFRLLNHSRIEIDSIATSPLYELGGDIVKTFYIQRALKFLECELELLNLRIQFPNSFSQSDEIFFKPELYITPKAKGLGVIGIVEIVVSIFLSKEIKDRNGKPASLIQIAKAFEYVFNVSLGNIYDWNCQLIVSNKLAIPLWSY